MGLSASAPWTKYYGSTPVSLNYPNLTKPFATVNSGVSVNVNQFYGRTVLYVGGNWVGSSDYKVVLNSGKLYLVPTT